MKLEFEEKFLISDLMKKVSSISELMNFCLKLYEIGY